MSSAKSPIELPPTEYHVCQVVGHGYRFVPACVKPVTRMKKDVLSGYLVGVVTLRNEDVRTRYVDANNTAHEEDRIYDLEELPTDTDGYNILRRLMKEYKLWTERVVIVNWKERYGRAQAIPSIAPEGFEIPKAAVTDDTQPENTAPPKEASRLANLGAIAKLSKLKNKSKKPEQHAE